MFCSGVSVTRMKKTNRKKRGWEPGSPVIHLHQVWEYLADRLRHCRRELSRCKAQYYGMGGNEENHGLYVCSLLKHTNNSYDVVNRVLTKSTDSSGIDPEVIDWAYSFRTCRERLRKLDHICTEDLYKQFIHFCSNYQAIGVSDDRLFTHYRAKLNSVKKLSDKITLMLGYLQLDSLPVHRSEIPMDLLQCECHSGHTIARLLPATIGSFEDYLDKFHDWLTLDKCYIDDLQDNIDKTRKQLKSIDKQQSISVVMYNTASTSLRKEKLVLDTLKTEFASFDMRELRNHDKQCHRIRLEILALENALQSIQREEESRDVPDCCVEELENLEEACGLSQYDKDYYQKR